MATRTKIEWRLRFSGALICIGLLVEIITLFWTHPTIFLMYLIAGGSFLAVGILLYLLALIPSDKS